MIDAIAIAGKLGLGGRTNTILQSAFFLINDSIMPYEEAQEFMKRWLTSPSRRRATPSCR